MTADSPEQAERQLTLMERSLVHYATGAGWTDNHNAEAMVRTLYEEARAADRAEVEATSRRTFEGYQEALARAIAAETRIEALEGALRELAEKHDRCSDSQVGCDLIHDLRALLSSEGAARG